MTDAMTDQASDARPRVPNARLAAGLGLVGAVAVAASLGLGVDAGPSLDVDAKILLGTGLYAIVAALAATATRPPFELEALGAEPSSGSPAWDIKPPITIGAVIVAVLELVAWMAPSPATAGAAIVVTGLAAVFFAAWAFGHHRGQLRFARLLLGARSLPTPAPEDVRGVVSGAVVGEGIEREVTFTVRTRRVATGQQTAQGVPRERTKSWIQGSGRTRVPETMELRAGEETIAVVTATARWAAPITWAALPSASAITAKSVARIAEGSSVLVLGRVRRDERGTTIRATGPDSLLVWGASRAALLRCSAVWIAVWSVLVALALACLATGAYLWSMAPQ